MTAYRTIVAQRIGDVGLLTLADPQTLNAASLPMVEELLDALERCVADGARALMITGAGRGFCSGANLTSAMDPDSEGYDAGRVLDTHFQPLIRMLRDMPIPVVTAVNGAAAGIGCSIALAGDIIIAGQGAYFLQAFRRIGLVPDGGSAFLLARSIGRVRAMEMMLMGEKIAAAVALEWGLITRMVPDARLADEALRIAADLAAGPTQALFETRRQCWRATEGSLDDALALERGQQRDVGRTLDHREGIAAFRDKRPPQFVGR